MWYILDENNNPVKVDGLTAGQWMDDSANRQQRQVNFSTFNNVSLSTVFLSLDHNHYGYGEPILYESLWFGGPFDGHSSRYKTRDEALLGHQRMLEEYLNELLSSRNPEDALALAGPIDWECPKIDENVTAL